MKIGEIAGWYGVLAILIAYGLNSFNVWGSQSIPYQLLNLSGAICVGWSALAKKAYQPFALEVAWALIAAISLAIILINII
jgi:hypothetical protein